MLYPNLQLNLPQPEELREITERYELRRAFVKKWGMLGFGLIYLPHYFYLKPADFHLEMINAMEDPEIDLLEIVGFRGCAKSSDGSVLLPIYAAVEKPEHYPFILPIADTGLQAAINIANIKEEFEHNDLLLQDYGHFDISKAIDKSLEDPTLESEEEWQAKNMLLSNGVRILARSRGQKVRGLRHRQHRPKLAVIDDPEDLEWVRMKENRDKTERWMNGEVLPAMDESFRKVVLLGNWLHRDALMARVKKRGRFHVLEYALFNDKGECRWPAKYPTQQKLDDKKAEMGAVAWQREMLLKVVAEDGAPVKEEWIVYYDEIPQPEIDPKTKEIKYNPIMGAGVGNDLAISKKETADYTTFVAGVSTKTKEDPKIHIDILPHPVNERLSFQETIARAKAVNAAVTKQFVSPMFFMEDVAFQRAAIEMVQEAGIPAEAVKVGIDKRSRLNQAAVFIQNGTVRFPRRGCEDLIAQILGFGVEEHDDLVDGFIQLVLGLMRISGVQRPEVISLL